MKKHTQFDAYVARRLDSWGREFALDREFAWLGHSPKNILQIIIEHKGQIPRREGGYRPEVTIPPNEWQIECVVEQIHRDAPTLAAVLRAYYCGWGRQGIERRAIAEQLLKRKMIRGHYFLYHDQGFHRVAGALAADAQKIA